MAADDIKQQLELPDVGQVEVVVEDLDRTVAFYESVFGIGPFEIREMEAPNVLDRGEEKHIKARVGFVAMGQVELELIHIVEGDSFHLDFLRQHGEGIHHLGFLVPDFEAKLERAKAMGFEVLQADPFGRFYAYLDTRRDGGIIFELIASTDANESVLRGQLEDLQRLGG